METIKLPNGNDALVAEYTEQEIEEYKGNPLIEALPVFSQQDVIDGLSVYPPYKKEERYLDEYKRLHFLQRILRYFQPFPIHIELQASIDRLIRFGYVSRNPLSKSYAQGFVDNWHDFQRYSKMNEQIQTGQTLSVIGVSGVGKTRTIQRMMAMYPQIISHTSYMDKTLNSYQITFLNIQTPFDGSVKTIIFDFMYQIDLLMGTNYFKRYSNSRLSTSQLMPIMAQIARNICLGLLIIDEIQHLKSIKSKNTTQVLNFFTTLINTVNIPLIMVGTPRAMDVLQTQFRQARRNTNIGNLLWKKMKKDEVWDLFISGLWEYQWTKKEVQLNEEFSNLIYEESQGITDIAIKLYMMTQLHAISNGYEIFTPQTIRKIAKEELQIVQPMLNALRTNNHQKLSEYDDLSFPDIEKYIERQKVVINEKQVLESLKQGVVRKNKESKIIENAVFQLGILGVDENVAKKTVSDILLRNSESDLQFVVKEAFKELTESISTEEKEIKRDLRQIVKMGKENGQCAYETLLSKGLIKRDYPVGDAS